MSTVKTTGYWILATDRRELGAEMRALSKPLKTDPGGRVKRAIPDDQVLDVLGEKRFVTRSRKLFGVFCDEKDARPILGWLESNPHPLWRFSLVARDPDPDCGEVIFES